MYSPAFIKFLIGRDADDFLSKENNDSEVKNRPIDNIIYRCSRYATVPVESKLRKN